MENRTNTHAMIPVDVVGSLANVIFDHEVMTVDENELAYLITLGANFSNKENVFEAIDELDKQICTLFALHKSSDAWNLIKENKETINFLEITKCPFFQLDRLAVDVFQYLFETNQIDDQDYAYFNVISGKFFDTDFMYKYLGSCKTATEVFDTLYTAFNNISPMQVGMIEYTDELRQIVESALTVDEDITNYVLGSAATIDFASADMIQFLKSGNISKKAIPLLSRCIFERSTVIESENCMNDIYGYVMAGQMADLFEKFTFDTLPYLETFMDFFTDHYSANELTNEESGICRIFWSSVMTSNAFLNYPRTILDMFEQKSGEYYSPDAMFLSIIIPAEKYPVFYLLRQMDMFPGIANVFHASAAYPQAYHVIVNTATDTVYAGGFDPSGKHVFKTYTIDEICNEQFTEDHAWAIMDKDGMFSSENVDVSSRCNSQEEYFEVCRAVNSFINTYADKY